MSNTLTMNSLIRKQLSQSVAKLLVVAMATMFVWLALGSIVASAASVSITVNGASSASVNPGDTVKLAWNASGVTNCSINTIGSVPLTGKKDVIAGSSNTTYTITCTGGSKSATISVSPTANVWASPSIASPDKAGGKAEVLVQWDSKNASKCTELKATGASGKVRYLFKDANEKVKDKLTDQISEKTTYTLKCVNTQSNKSDTDTATVNFEPFGPPDIYQLKTNKGTSAAYDPDYAGVKVKISWGATNVDYCERKAEDLNGNEIKITGWTIKRPNSGTKWIQAFADNVILPESVKLTLTCGRDSGQDVSQSLTFTVTDIPPGGGAGKPVETELIVPASVTVPKASDLPAKVNVSIEAKYGDQCFYTAKNLKGQSVSVSKWTNRLNHWFDTTDNFDIFVPETVDLTFRCTRSSDGAEDSDTKRITVSVSPNVPPKIVFSASPLPKANGQAQVLLNWVTEGVNKCTDDDVITNGSVTDFWYKNGGALPLAGVTPVPIYGNTTLSLTCENTSTGEDTTETVIIELDGSGNPNIIQGSAVVNPNAPSIVVTNVDPDTPVKPDDIVDITWDGENVDHCVLSDGAAVSITGLPDDTKSVSPKTTTTYTISCPPIGGGPDVFDTTTVEVDDGNPTVDLSVSENEVEPGGTVVLSWESYNTDICTSADFNTANATSNTALPVQVNGSIGTVVTYTITCDKNPTSGKPATDTVSVTIKAATDPSVNLSVDKTEVESGDDITLKWTSKNADVCNGTNFNTSGATNNNAGVTDTVVGAVGTVVTYTITCDKNPTSGKPATDTVKVTIKDNALPPTPPSDPEFKVEPSVVRQGDPVLIIWTIDFGLTCEITSGGVAVAGVGTLTGGTVPDSSVSGSYELKNITAEKTYTLTCTSDNGAPDPDPQNVTVRVLPEVQES
ncbi:hypothetical protein KC845_03925 [Candidatus Kaiserbacteria bacterium]|nr:hypothetical protein [Candidatus Kaiserbacteria bacterium]